MARLGMDVDAVERIGRQLQRQGDYLSGIVSQIDGLVSQSSGVWHGADGRGFADEWRSRHRQSLLDTAHAARDLGARAISNAADQRRVSGSFGTKPQSGMPALGNTSGDRSGLSKALVGPELGLGAALAQWGMRINGFKVVPADLSGWTLRAAYVRERGWRALSGQDSSFGAFRSLHDGLDATGAFWDLASGGLDQVHSDVTSGDYSSTGSTIGDTALLTARAAVVGGMAGLGGAGGAFVGGVLGSVVPGPGTAIGMAVGGWVGSEVGEAAGRETLVGVTWAGNTLGDALFDAGSATSSAVTEGSRAVHDFLDTVGGSASQLVTPSSWWGRP